MLYLSGCAETDWRYTSSSCMRPIISLGLVGQASRHFKGDFVKKTKKKNEFVTVSVMLPGDVLDSIKEIANYAGTDVNTVANVILALGIKKMKGDK
jgi:hypothetical protein